MGANQKPANHAAQDEAAPADIQPPPVERVIISGGPAFDSLRVRDAATGKEIKVTTIALMICCDGKLQAEITLPHAELQRLEADVQSMVREEQ
jgi:hypothetical protein